jgi:hypothetical protein
MNIKPLYKRDLLSKARVPPLRENVATIELFWAQITDHLAEMALTASPVENSHIAKGTVEMFSGESLYKPSQADIRILARRLREETVGRQCRRRFANLLIEWRNVLRIPWCVTRAPNHSHLTSDRSVHFLWTQISVGSLVQS